MKVTVYVVVKEMIGMIIAKGIVRHSRVLPVIPILGKIGKKKVPKIRDFNRAEKGT